MDAPSVFRQGLGSVIISRPQQQQYFPLQYSATPPQQQQQHHHLHHHHLQQPPQFQTRHRDDADTESASNRIAHTLNACCRCRARKTRCDPTLPRCLPCKRANAKCDYFDTTKNKRIDRSYVVNLMDRARKLRAELSQYTDEDGEPGGSHEAMGGMVRLNDTDETPRYLGPSSGIAMTRLLMEEAKRYTESKSISELVPEVRARRLERVNRSSSSKKSYPILSAVPAESLPGRPILDRLIDVYCQRAQMMMQPLHEKSLVQDIDAVFNGDMDPYKRFVTNMVVAISLQKLDLQYAGLADSYYLAAMLHFEEVVQPKDLKTLQCLVLIGQYSLLTPTRTAVYYVIGLAVGICQQLGLCEEKTIAMGTTDPQIIDLRRRLCWNVTTNEFGLAHIMGRPNGFGKSDEFMDVEFFATVDDEFITPEGIGAGPVSDKKLIAIHFCKMRLLQAEIRRVLYDRKRAQPDRESHPWFGEMEQKLDDWRDSAPEQPSWCRPWFMGRYHTMVITMYRPSPQLPKPSSESAQRCFESAKYVLCLSHAQVKRGSVDLTWVFLLVIYMVLNTLLWTISYPEVRAKYPRDQAEELVEAALDIIRQCYERWPGSSAASDLYVVFAKACMQSYDVKEDSPTTTEDSYGNTMSTPRSRTGADSPDSDSTTPGPPRGPASPSPMLFKNASPFGFDMGADKEEMAPQHSFASPFPSHLAFRSNSIFHNPGTESNGRRGSYFPPDFTHTNDQATPGNMDGATPGNMDGAAPPPLSQNSFMPSSTTPVMRNDLPSPPDSVAPSSSTLSNRILSPALSPSAFQTTHPDLTPTMAHATPNLSSLQASPLPPNLKYEPSGFNSPQMKPPPYIPNNSRSTFTLPTPPQPNPYPRAAPPNPAFGWSQSFAPSSNFQTTNYWGGESAASSLKPFGLGLMTGIDDGHHPGGGGSFWGDDQDGELADFDMFSGMGFPSQFQSSAQQQRMGSLTHEQQLLLLGELEVRGKDEIDQFLSPRDQVQGDVEMNW